jgi:hypothetical protein
MPGVVKIDVEAAELQVLSGGASVLQAGPTIICEVAACNATTVGDLLGAHGYTLYDGDQPAAQRVPEPVAPGETLAISGRGSRRVSQSP